MTLRLTKWTHACVVLQGDGGPVVVDPGSFSEVDRALAGAAAVLITHEHADHVAVDPLTEALRADAELTLRAPAAVAARFAEFGDRVTAVGAGESFDVEGLSVRTVGGRHAVIHPDVPVPDNVGFVVDGGAVYHPGDALFVPDADVQVLLAPVSSPWAKVSEVVDFVRAVGAPRTVGIHEAIFSSAGLGLVAGLMGSLVPSTGYSLPEPGTTVEV